MRGVKEGALIVVILLSRRAKTTSASVEGALQPLVIQIRRECLVQMLNIFANYTTAPPWSLESEVTSYVLEPGNVASAPDDPAPSALLNYKTVSSMATPAGEFQGCVMRGTIYGRSLDHPSAPFSKSLLF